MQSACAGGASGKFHKKTRQTVGSAALYSRDTAKKLNQAVPGLNDGGSLAGNEASLNSSISSQSS